MFRYRYVIQTVFVNIIFCREANGNSEEFIYCRITINELKNIILIPQSLGWEKSCISRSNDLFEEKYLWCICNGQVLKDFIHCYCTWFSSHPTIYLKIVTSADSTILRITHSLIFYIIWVNTGLIRKLSSVIFVVWRTYFFVHIAHFEIIHHSYSSSSLQISRIFDVPTALLRTGQTESNWLKSIGWYVWKSNNRQTGSTIYHDVLWILCNLLCALRYVWQLLASEPTKRDDFNCSKYACRQYAYTGAHIR